MKKSINLMSFKEELYITIATREENTLNFKSRGTAVQNTVSNYCSKFQKLRDKFTFLTFPFLDNRSQNSMENSISHILKGTCVTNLKKCNTIIHLVHILHRLRGCLLDIT